MTDMAFAITIVGVAWAIAAVRIVRIVMEALEHWENKP
jgi:uncharacterized membrane protein YccF (DUF307 family)